MTPLDQLITSILDRSHIELTQAEEDIKKASQILNTIGGADEQEKGSPGRDPQDRQKSQARLSPYGQVK